MAAGKKTKENWRDAEDVENYDESSDVYYTKQTHQSVVDYIHDDSLTEFDRNKLFEKEIYPAFSEMVKIMINTYKFFYTGTDIQSLIQEVTVQMFHVLEKSRTDEEKGYKEHKGASYSYFSRVVKNYLIQKQRKNQDKKRKYGLSSINEDEKFYEESFYEEEQDVNLQEFIDYFMKWLENNVDNILEKEEDRAIAFGILNIMADDEAELKNRKMIFYMIKEQTGEDSYRINKVLNIIKDYYNEIKNDYLETFYISPNKSYLELSEREDDE